jgi:hypothetical protein
VEQRLHVPTGTNRPLSTKREKHNSALNTNHSSSQGNSRNLKDLTMDEWKQLVEASQRHFPSVPVAKATTPNKNDPVVTKVCPHSVHHLLSVARMRWLVCGVCGVCVGQFSRHGLMARRTRPSERRAGLLTQCRKKPPARRPPNPLTRRTTIKPPPQRQ